MSPGRQSNINVPVNFPQKNEIKSFVLGYFPVQSRQYNVEYTLHRQIVGLKAPSDIQKSACTIVWESSPSKKKMYKCIWQNKNWTRTNLSKKCLLATDCLCHIILTTFCVWTLLIWINQRLEVECFSHNRSHHWVNHGLLLGVIGTFLVGHDDYLGALYQCH